MLNSSNARKRPRIEPQADVANKGTLSAADSLRVPWPEYLVELWSSMPTREARFTRALASRRASQAEVA